MDLGDWVSVKGWACVEACVGACIEAGWASVDVEAVCVDEGGSRSGWDEATTSGVDNWAATAASARAAEAARVVLRDI